MVKYGDYDQIATVFTRQHGVIKLMIKGGLSTKRHRGAPVSPLTRAEFVYFLGRGDLYQCTEVSPLERYHQDNPTYAHLEAACAMSQAVRQSQLLEKPAPKLYELLQIFLTGLRYAQDPAGWTVSFLLKVLRHEGLISNFSTCVHCETPLTNVYIGRGEAFCSLHAPAEPIILTDEEAKLVECLLKTRSVSELDAIEISKDLHSKMTSLFARLV